MERLPVSVCMIVRDEAEVLGVALASVMPWAAQVVVVDTGSTDGSLDVARRHGAVTTTIAWEDDFSAARNVSMDLATAPWILILDADEWIDPEDVAALAALLEVGTGHGYRLPQFNYVDSPGWAGLRAGPIPPVWGLDAVGWVVARQMRLVPNRPDVRYEGAVHETLVPSLETAGIELHDAEIPIHHVGKLRAAAVMARKKQLYKRLGEIKLQANPSGMASMELGIQCSELGEHEEARRLLADAIETLPSGAERARAVACLASMLEILEGTDAAVALLHRELPREATHPDLWERLGVVLMRARQFGRAAEVLERAMVSFPDASNLLRLAGEAELALRQYRRAAEIYARLEDAVDGVGMGVSGRAVAAAGAGDPTALVACLRSAREAIVEGARVGAARWLDAAWPLSTDPGAFVGVPPALARRLFAAAWTAQRRPVLAHAALPLPSTASAGGIEALTRALRGTDVPAPVAARLAAAVGARRWGTLPMAGATVPG